MGRQNEAIAYGRPSYGGIVIGGENAGVYTLGDDWTDRADLTGLLVQASIWVHGDTDALIDERVATLEAILQDLGNLGITFGSAVAGTASIAMSSQDLVVTATSSIFTAEHVGLALDLAGVGSFQITEYTSGTVVKCRIPTAQTSPASASGLSVRIGRVWRRGIEADKLGFFSGRATLNHPQDAGNEPRRRRYNLTLSFARPASDTRSDTDRQSATARFINPPGGSRAVAISGVFTASKKTGTAENAIERYEAEIGAYIDTVVELFMGSGVSIGTVGEDSIRLIDDTTNLISFEVAREELIRNESSGALDHPALTEVNIELSRPTSLSLGVQQLARSMVVASYSARLVRGQITEAGFDDLWKTVIYPSIIDDIESVFSSGVCVATVDGPRFNLKTWRVSANVIGTLLDTGSTIMGYSRSQSIQIDFRKRFRNRLDGKELSALKHSPGRVIVAATSVAFTERLPVGSGSSGSQRSLGVFGQGDLGISGIEGGFDLGGLELDGVALGASRGRSEFVRFPEKPSDPRLRYQGVGGIEPIPDGVWEETGLSDSDTTKVVGEDGLGLSIPCLETVSSIIRLWRWVDLSGSTDRAGARAATGSPNAQRQLGIHSEGG